eukprot:1901081-Pyramimonas_sp.AAC.1
MRRLSNVRDHFVLLYDGDVSGARMMMLAVRRPRIMLTPPTSASGPCGRGASFCFTKMEHQPHVEPAASVAHLASAL